MNKLKLIMPLFLLCNIFNNGININTLDINRKFTDSSTETSDEHDETKNCEKYSYDLLGQGINNVTGDPYDLRKGRAEYHILNKDYLHSLIDNSYYTDIKESNVISNEATSASELNVKLDFDYKSSNSLTYKIATKGLINSLEIDVSVDFKKTTSQYYKSMQFIFNAYDATLADSPAFSNRYTEHLDENYLENLNQAINNIKGYTFSNLFDTYGTHLVTQVSYGATAYATFIASSSAYDLSGSISVEANSKFNNSTSISDTKDSIVKKDNGGFEVKLDVGYNTSYVEEQFYAYGIAGNPISFGDDKTKFADQFSTWASNIKYSDKDSLGAIHVKKAIPLYDLLPSDYDEDVREEMVTAYKKYYNDYASEDDTKFDLDLDDQIITSIQCSDRTNEVRVNKNDYSENDAIIVDVKENNINFVNLLNCGYTKFHFEFWIDRREINDGYQIFKMTLGNDVFKIDEIVAEYGAKNTPVRYFTGQEKWIDKTFDINQLSENDLKTFKNGLNTNELKVFMGANGYGKNVWAYRNLKMVVDVSK